MTETAVTIEQVLLNRDRRVERQRELLKSHSCVVSFSLNIPGNIKLTELSLAFFKEGVKLIREKLKGNGLEIKTEFETVEVTGGEYCAGLNADAGAVKKALLELEESIPAGRVFDIDVLGADGKKLSRVDFGYEARRCMLCGDNAFICRRSGRHSLEELNAEAQRLMRGYFDGVKAEKIADAAYRAAVAEVETSPKPGAVDRFDSGAHKDMDISTFLKSAEALRPWFRRFAEAGTEAGRRTADPTENEEELFNELRRLGLEAERDMFAATGGINTHKGLIFSFALLCASSAMLPERELSPENVLRRAGSLAKYALGDFKTGYGSGSHGMRLKRELGCGGIRQEAAEGYPSVRTVGLPELEKDLNEGMTLNDAAVRCFLALMSSVEDSTVLYRGGREALEYMRARSAEALNGTPETEMPQGLEEMNRDFTGRNISAGGCADLLAICLLLHFICTESLD